MLAHEAWLASRIAQPRPPHGEAAFVCTHAVENPSADYRVFDWHAGATLEVLLARGRPFDVADIVAGATAIARALGRLHRHGVIHRDLKPGNLHLGDDGRWRVLDLGAALSASDPKALRRLHAGTPSYMNPEQWGRDGAEPADADEASDLYALGVTLYQWLTGKLPYGEIEPYQTGRFRHDPKAPSRLRPDCPIWLDRVVLKAVTVTWYVVSRMPAQSPGTARVKEVCASCSGASLPGAAGMSVGIAPMLVQGPCTRVGTPRNGQPAPPIVVRPQPAVFQFTSTLVSAIASGSLPKF